MFHSIVLGCVVLFTSLSDTAAIPQESGKAETAAVVSKTGTIEGVIKTRRKRYAAWNVVWIKDAKGKFVPPKKHPVMDQKDLKFVPHVLPVLVGTTVDYLNSDSVAHNVFSPDNEGYNLGTWPKGQTKSYTFKKTGIYTQLCNVHPEMEAFVLVLSTPYFAVSDKAGKYRIEGVPEGSYTLSIWSAKMKDQEKPVTVKAGETAKVAFELKRH